MKIEVIKGKITHNGKTYDIGEELIVKKDEGERLIRKGVAVDPETLEVDDSENDPKGNASDNDPPNADSEDESEENENDDEDEE